MDKRLKELYDLADQVALFRQSHDNRPLCNEEAITHLSVVIDELKPHTQVSDNLYAYQAKLQQRIETAVTESARLQEQEPNREKYIIKQTEIDVLKAIALDLRQIAVKESST